MARCKDCNGNGHILCPVCKGTKKDPRTGNPCGYCNGAGHVECGACNGSGVERY